MTAEQEAAVIGRPPTALDALAGRHFEAYLDLDPDAAASLGVPGREGRVTDYSSAGYAARAALAQGTLRELESTAVADRVDAVTAATMRDRLGLEVAIHEAGLAAGVVSVIANGAHELRMAYDLMPRETVEHWEVLDARMAATPAAVASYAESVRDAIASGRPPARRQTLSMADTLDELADPREGFFVTDAQPGDSAKLPTPLRESLARNGSQSAEAYAELTRLLRGEFHEAAVDHDAVGQDAYALLSRFHVGAALDLDETYAWGLEELARIEAEMASVARQIVPGGSVDDAVAALDADASRSFATAEEFRDWMQVEADRALRELRGRHFDIPEPIARIECCIAPTTSGGIYYSPPSEDFTRPGRMWWEVPRGHTQFSTWRELTTVYHEGVPGHHLQIAQTMMRTELLNRWRRMGYFVSGHGEGWALYAERLMADLGYLDDPGNRLGMLDAAAFRAMRVVVDIGVHCGLEAPAEVGGGVWTPESMWEFMSRHTRTQEGFLKFEHLRYLGWPGQAPAYKVGERLWSEIRTERERQAGGDFDLAGFHREALDLGSVPLDVLREALLS